MTAAGIQFRTLPNELYTIPKAHLLFKPAENEDFILLGDTEEITIEPTVEETDVYTNEAGIRQLAITIVTQIEATVSFTLKQLSAINRALSMLGEVQDMTQAASVGLTVSRVAPAHEGEIVRLAGPAENVVVEDGIQAVVYTEGTDYRVDYEGGFVQLLNIPAGADGDVLITYDAVEILAADGLKLIPLANKSENRGTLVIRGTNEVGKRVMVTLHDVQLRPAGERNFVSDTDIDTIEIEGRVFRDETQAQGFELGFERDLD